MKIVKDLRRLTRLPLDCHLMIVEPEKYVEAFREAGADVITFHYESTPHQHRLLRRLREIGAKPHRLPSGPLHDAAEVARVGVPTIMMFVQSLHGISHNRIEDTREEHLELAVTAFDKLAEKTMRWMRGD